MPASPKFLSLSRTLSVRVSPASARVDEGHRQSYIAYVAQRLKRPEGSTVRQTEDGIEIRVERHVQPPSVNAVTESEISSLESALYEMIREIERSLEDDQFRDEAHSRGFEAVSYDERVRRAVRVALRTLPTEFQDFWHRNSAVRTERRSIADQKTAFAEHPDWRAWWSQIERTEEAVWAPPPRYRWMGTDHWQGLEDNIHPLRSTAHIPLTRELSLSLNSRDRLRALLRESAYYVNAANADGLMTQLAYCVKEQSLVLECPDEHLLRQLVAALLRQPRGPHRRVLDTWARSWTPFSGFGTLALVVVALGFAWIPITMVSSIAVAQLVLLVLITTLLTGSFFGANPRRIALGMAPALLMWGFALLYALVGHVTWKTDPLTWIDPLFLTLSVATGSFLDYSVDGSLTVRFITFVETLLTITLVGSTLVAVTTTIIRGLRNSERSDNRDG